MAVRQVMLCDIDQNEPAQSYRITYPDGVVWEVELCDVDHDVRIQQFRAEQIGHEVKPGGRRRVFQVTALEEIGKKDQPPAAKKTAKKASGRKRP